MKEDPLERLDRIEKEKKTGAGPAKAVMIALIAAVVALAPFWLISGLPRPPLSKTLIWKRRTSRNRFLPFREITRA